MKPIRRLPVRPDLDQLRNEAETLRSEEKSRKPEAKHRILELYVQYGLTLPDTPVMALHRGRLDLLEDHLRRRAVK